MRRRFEFQEGTSNKFWEIELQGTQVTTSWGRIGTAGQNKSKDFDSIDKAQTEYEKLIEEKTSKGYVESAGAGAGGGLASAGAGGRTVEEAWQRIEKWLEANAPKIIGNLNPGASDEEIAAIEELIGKKMPQAWRDVYRVHNGLNDEANLGSLFYGYEFLSLTRVEQELENQKEDVDEEDRTKARVADTGIRRNNLHNDLWVPIAHDGGDTLIRLDLDPAKGGRTGQIILTDYGYDAAILLAGSIEELMWNFVDDLEKGYYFLDEDAIEDGNEFLNCVPEIDVCNWLNSPRFEHLKTSIDS